ncbi:hypothetical protein SAMN04487886_104116 [Clostridium sp. DSM 8431]|uniref:hypothetical protein n=1 Tax=Clostridium sp. DSM 8431 TaxID=1761781 RepID=UPI0008E35CA7|nr:hypothetical protein [Clostridium sp. DSM 8431]SFU49775.1 hypothetical protein SAMN04487886_104116 [Clostridium sp. DSM 8431]
MDIYKALKKEKAEKKIMYIILGIIAIILPIAVFLTGLTSFFYLTCLFFLEFLIFLSVISIIGNYTLKFSCSNNRLKIKSGLLSKESLMLCDKVVLVHTEKMEEEMEVIILTTVKFRNRSLKPIMKGFLKRYPKVAKELEKIKMNNEDEVYYFQVIRRGGLNKYMLLDTVYKNCVKAVYTDDCIKNIKIARGQTLV